MDSNLLVNVAQSCLPLCDPMDYTDHGILQARILEWVAFPFSRGSSQPREQTQVSHIAGGFFTSWATGKHKNTRAGNLSLLQGIFLTQESNQGLLHCRRILYHLSHQGSPWILEWVTYPFSRGSSRPRNWTRISCNTGGFFTSWATREAPPSLYSSHNRFTPASRSLQITSPLLEHPISFLSHLSNVRFPNLF